ISAAGSTVAIGGQGHAGLLGSLLGELLTGDDSFSLSVTELDSLRETTFLLGGFLTRLGVTDVLDAADEVVRADELIQAILENISNLGGSVDPAVSDLLEQLEVVETNLPLGDVIRILGNASSLNSAEVPVYDTLVSLALNLLEGTVFSLDPTFLKLDLAGLPGVSGLLDVKISAYLMVGNAPTVSVGTAQYTPEGYPHLQF